MKGSQAALAALALLLSAFPAAAQLRLRAASNLPAMRVVRRGGATPLRSGASVTTSRASAASTTISELLSSSANFRVRQRVVVQTR